MAKRQELKLLQSRPDRMCWARALDNSLRRRFSPPRRDLDDLGLAEGDSVADIGAGPGYFDPEILGRIGPSGRLVLADIDAENLDIARRRLSSDPRVTVLQASAGHLERIPSGSIDRALMSLVLCCLWDKAGALGEAWRILRPGGRVLVTYRRCGPLASLRRHSMANNRSHWATLAAMHPWRAIPVPSGRLVVRHLLEKPAGDGSMPA